METKGHEVHSAFKSEKTKYDKYYRFNSIQCMICVEVPRGMSWCPEMTQILMLVIVSNSKSVVEAKVQEY